MRRSMILSFVAVALIIGVVLGSNLLPTRTTITSTITQIVTLTNRSTRLYELIFNQTGSCSPPAWLAPWSVTLENKTIIVEPPSATPNISEDSFFASPSLKSYSVIEFSVPNGAYNYTVKPSFLGQVGNVTVNGGDVVVQVQPAHFSCRTSTVSTTTSG